METHLYYALSVVLATVFHCIPSIAQDSLQQDIPGFYGFEVEAAQNVTAGQNFQVRLTIKATNFQDLHSEETGQMRVLSGEWNQERHPDGYVRATCTMTCFTSRFGEVLLPRLTGIVSGKQVFSPKQTISVQPNSEYGEELAAAVKCLQDNGLYPDTCLLEMCIKQPLLYVFEDKYAKRFAIVARREMAPMLGGNLVLTYSGESRLALENMIDKTLMLNYYGSVLASLQQGDSLLNVQAMVNAAADTTVRKIGPILRTAWNQREPFNQLIPISSQTGLHQPVGCVPVALAQVMRLYGYARPSFQWDSMPDSYVKGMPDEQFAELARLLNTLGVCLSAEYGDEGTSSSLAHAKRVMVDDMGYSPHITHLDNRDGVFFGRAVSRELLNGRPCVVSTKAHAIVCDGLDGDFFHFNFGWGASANGWYRLLLTKGMNTQWPYCQLLIGLAPHPNTPSTRILRTKKGGQLAELITPEELLNIDTLSIHGTLNSADIRLLRRMAGAIDNDEDIPAIGTLSYLDISDVKLQTDDEPFVTVKAYGRGYVSTVVGDGNNAVSDTYEVDFDNMTDAVWERFTADGRDRQPGMRYVRNGAGVWINCSCVADTLSPYMFSGCTNLHTVYIPKNVATIETCAFLECASLQHVWLPASVRSLASSSFAFTPSLKVVYYPKGGDKPEVEAMTFQGSNPDGRQLQPTP